MNRKLLPRTGAALLLAASTHAAATELVYTPINPSFGGSPLNGAVLLNSAQATNRHEENPLDGLSLSEKTPLQSFNESLERAILSRLASAATAL